MAAFLHRLDAMIKRGGSGSTGWVRSGSTWKYIDCVSGNPLQGLQVVSGGTYFFDGSGNMSTGWVTVNGVPYDFGNNGSWVKYHAHNIAWAGQPNSYYCGPTVGFMILRNVGAGNSRYNGAGLTINNVANHMETDRYGYTSFNNRKFQQGMNRWLGSDIYATAELPSYATVRQEVLDSYRNGYATAFDAHERRGGPHYNGHGNSTFSHIVVVDAYNQDTDVATIVDCSSSWYSNSSQKFNYDLSDFVGRFVNAPDWGYRDGIGMYYAKN